MENTTIEPVDVAAILDGTHTAPETAVGGRRSDGTALLYAEAVNVLLGPPEAGKTLVAGAMSADELYAGGRVLWIDLDHNGPAAIITRMRGFGISRDVLTDLGRFRLYVPEDADEIQQIIAAEYRPTLAVVDSIGELLPMYGANSNDADDYTRVHRQVLTALANRGAGVLGIDHEAKGVESRNYGATGSAAKKRAVDGALLRVTNLRPFRPGSGGEAVLSIVKDRHGSLRAMTDAEREPNLSVFSIDSAGMYRFALPALREHSPDDVDLLAALNPAPTSQRDVQRRMGWGGTRALKALRALRERSGSVGDGDCSPAPLPLGGSREHHPGAPDAAGWVDG